jgi:hypothetical protein
MTEGTYPFVGGGVSTWCDVLVLELPQVDYHICAVTGDPNVKLKYELMPNVVRVIHVPLWGTEEPAEFILPEVPFSEIYLHKQETTHQVVEEEFIPLFRHFLQGMEETGPDMTPYGCTVHELYHYFQQYDYMESFKATQVWEVFQDEILRPYRWLILAGVECLSEHQAALIHDFVDGGGRIVLTGNAGWADEWGQPRRTNALDSVPALPPQPLTRTRAWATIARVKR